MARTYQDLIREEVKLDTRKLYLNRSVRGRSRGSGESVKTFVDERANIS